MRKILIGTTWSVIAASISVAACATHPAPDPGESGKLGRAAQAVLDGVDDTSPEANIVVALDGPNGQKGVCSGVLLTPTIVLTTRTCVGPTKAGSKPIVRVGSSLTTAKTYVSVGSIVQSGNPGDPASTTATGDLAIVYLEPTLPVWDNVAIPHQPFIAPPSVPGSATGDGSQVYENIGVSGWAPSGDALGVRKQLAFDAVRLISQANAPLWLRNTATAEKGKLAAQDLGGPLFSLEWNNSRRLLGIASMTGIVSNSPSACPAGATCDAWVDLTQGEALDWVRSLLVFKASEHDDYWEYMHPRLGDALEWYRGEVDYAGPCQDAEDADCDHIYDENTDWDGAKSPRDNCPRWYNPDQTDSDLDGVGDPCDNCPSTYNRDQADTSIARQKLTRGPVKLPAPGKHATPDNWLVTQYAGDACRPKVRALPLQAGGDFVSTGGRAAVANSTVFVLGDAANLPDTQHGTVLAKTCKCDGTFHCKAWGTPDKVGYCSLLDSTTAKHWKPMTLTNAAPKTPVGHFAAEFPTATFSVQRITWNYRTDYELPPVKFDSSVQVFSGLTGLWVVNYKPGKASEQDLPDTEVMDPGGLLDRVQVAETIITETVGPLNLPKVTDLPKLVDIFPLGCPSCQQKLNRPEPLVLDPKVFSGFDSVRVLAPAGAPRTAASAVDGLSADVVRNMQTPGTQIVVSSDAVGASSRAVVVESATGRVASVIEQKTNGSLSVREPAIVRSYAPASTAGGGKLTGGRRVVAMSSFRNQMADFGADGQGGVEGVIVVSDLETGRQANAALSGEPLGTVFAATYRGLDDCYYVVDVEAEGSRVRLLRVDSRWKTTVVAQWPKTRNASYLLTTGDSGELLLTSLLEEGFAVVVLESPKWGAWSPSLALRGAELAAAPARLSAGQLGIAVVSAGIVKAISVPLTPGRSGRLTVSRTDVGVVGLRKCNIAEAF